ncbi:MAG: DUF4153 domain-containing protein [Bacteroidetes bacterium]|nr:DUF4153 domain-containing protein [Bacteroidota bacterium]
MKEEILKNLDKPNQLERLYRENKTTFKTEFNLIYPDVKENLTAQVWNERLNYKNEDISWGTSKELIFVIVAAFIAGLIAKIPEFTSIKEDFFYQRNIAFIVFPALASYFLWKQNFQIMKTLVISVAVIISAIYINFLPNYSKSDTLLLACIHLPLLQWAILGFSFMGNNLKNYNKRLDFLRYNGDLVVMTTIILIAGGILTGITIGLFSLIKIEIQEFYFKYIVVWGLAASPIVGTYLVQTNPHLVNRVSPVIAKVFTPLVLITLVIYLIAVMVTGKDPYNDREFLLIFNMLLIGVMAIILFSIAETSKKSESKFAILLLFVLSIVTILVNGIALTAILFRISEWGLTPNRLAVLGGNILILTNLCIVTYWFLKAIKDNYKIENVEKSIAAFLPIYCLWTVFVTFFFPLMFNFK